MPGRHTAPRHIAPRSIKHSLGRLAGRTAHAVPVSRVATAVALCGAAGAAIGLGAFTSADGSSSRAAVSELSATVSSDAVVDALDERAHDEGMQVSRSAARPPVLKADQRAAKAASLPANRQAVSRAVTASVAPTDPRDIALSMLGDYGWSTDQFSCLDSLWIGESNWNPQAANPYSGAFGIPQSLPGSKMSSAGSDWRTNPATQIEWGLGYIKARYGSPCGALGFKQGNNWY